ncbi:MAG: FecR domain-containing protein [Steroidobacteraceae bacterium]
MSGKVERQDDDSPPTLTEQVAEVFVRRLQEDWSPADQATLERHLAESPAYAAAYRCVEESWGSLDTHAETPELMAYRQEAIAYVRRSSAARWLKKGRSGVARLCVAAAAAGIALLVAAAWQLSPFGYRPGEYRTAIGEQRLIELEDHSRIALDAATRVRVSYTDDARVVNLQSGQAQFSVAKDPTRPFKVVVGDRTIVALGTVFTVEYVASQVHVAMMEGTVSAVSASGVPIELTAGEELRVSRRGEATVTPHADIKAATAWREGEVILRTETLGVAVERMNRYSKVQVRIGDPALAAQHVSGVFEAGDTRGFLSAVQQLLPIGIHYTSADTVELTAR